eukprot:s1082_g11.t1
MRRLRPGSWPGAGRGRNRGGMLSIPRPASRQDVGMSVMLELPGWQQQPLASAGREDLADLVLQMVQEDGSVPLSTQQCNICIMAHGSAMNWDSALNILRDMSDWLLQANSRSFSSLLPSVNRAGEWELSLRLFEEMAVVRAEQDVLAHKGALSAMQQGQRWEQSLQHLASMQDSRLTPDAVCYTTVITGCSKAALWQTAVDLLGACSLPDDVCYNATMLVCESAGRWQQALQLFHAMPSAGVLQSVDSHSLAVKSLIRLALWHQAVELCRSAATAQRGLSATSVAEYYMLLKMAQRTSLWEMALDTFFSMHEREVAPDDRCYAVLLDACHAGGQSQRMLNVLRQYPPPAEPDSARKAENNWAQRFKVGIHAVRVEDRGGCVMFACRTLEPSA